MDNLHVIEGMAPEALEELPAPDCVFIGGSKGKLYEILDAIRKKNPFVRVVLNAISLETMMQVLKYTEENEIEEAEVIQVAVSRAKKVGSYHMMNGQNPIYVISFTSRPAKKEADPENEDDFVLEEINHNFSGFLLFPVLSASVAATFTSRLILGRDTVFNFSGLPVLQYSDYWVILAAGIICGILGALFNYGLLNAARLYKLLPNNSCLQNFLLLAITAITGLYLPEALGGGDDLLTNTAFNSYPVTVLLMFLAAKILLTLLAFGRGLPGGAFIPTLVAGGVAGAVMAGLFSQAGLLSSAYKTNIVILSMAAFFTASVRTPITATVLVMEMTGSFLHLLPLALASLTAFATTEIWRAKPLYGELFMRLLKNTKALERNHAEQERSIIELTVDTGSTADGRLVREINWPRHSLLVDVKRGDEELIPEGNTRLHSGDTLYVLCYPTEIAELEKLTAK